jgi:hypothetical protein
MGLSAFGVHAGSKGVRARTSSADEVCVVTSVHPK